MIEGQIQHTCMFCGTFYQANWWSSMCSRCFKKRNTMGTSNTPEIVNDMDTLKDSGERREFNTGSVRDKSEGKGRFDLVPPEAVRALAVQMELGATKYGERNWELGQPIRRSFLDSGLRHLMQVLEGKTDEDHLRAALWNIACAYTTRERVKAGKLPKELNDLPSAPSTQPTNHE